jgi:hypothetical protein
MMKLKATVIGLGLSIATAVSAATLPEVKQMNIEEMQSQAKKTMEAQQKSFSAKRAEVEKMIAEAVKKSEEMMSAQKKKADDIMATMEKKQAKLVADADAKQAAIIKKMESFQSSYQQQKKSDDAKS